MGADHGDDTGDLVRRVQHGDAEAFSALHRMYQGMVISICLRWAGNRSDAEELAQDVMVLAYTHIGQLSDADRFAAWIARIAVNACRNWAARKRESHLPLDDVIIPEPREPAIAGDVQDTLDELPPDVRDALRMFYMEGFSRRELAALRGVPESTIRSRLAIGRRMMREGLTEMEHGSNQDRCVEPARSRVLVAVPNMDFADSLCDALRTAGYAADAIAARGDILSAVRRLKPTVLVLSRTWDGSDYGYTVNREIRSDPRLRPTSILLLLPSGPSEEDILEAWKAGVDVCLSGQDIEQVLDFVGRLGRMRRARECFDMAVDHAWKRETPAALECLTEAIRFGGADIVRAAKEEPAFFYIRLTPEMRALIGE